MFGLSEGLMILSLLVYAALLVIVIRKVLEWTVDMWCGCVEVDESKERALWRVAVLLTFLVVFGPGVFSILWLGVALILLSLITRPCQSSARRSSGKEGERHADHSSQPQPST